MPTLQFLNVDLEILSEKEPMQLLGEMGRKMIVLHSGKFKGGHFVRLELEIERPDANQILWKWIGMIKGLTPRGRREWRNAKSKVFDVGFDVSQDAETGRIELAAEVLAAIAEIGGSYTVTLYPAEPPPTAILAKKSSR